jgi:hypothetical protein
MSTCDNSINNQENGPRRRWLRLGGPTLLLFAVIAVTALVPGKALASGPQPMCTIGPPSNTATPTVSPSGTVDNGTQLTTTTGSWSSCGSSVTGYLYQWLRGGQTIPGATSSTYTSTTDDTGYLVTSSVAACNSDSCSDYVQSSNSADVEPSVDTGSDPSPTLDSQVLESSDGQGGGCWTHVWRKQWGTWPYEQKVYLHTHWCGTGPGNYITSRNSWVTTGSTICSSHDSWTALFAGGVGYPTMTIEGGSYFDCNTAIPWIVIHKTRSFQIEYSAGGGSWVP